MKLREAASLLVVALSLFAGGCSSTKLDQRQKIDRVVVVKSAHTMTLYAANRPLKTYKVALGRGAGDAKQHKRDHETPEGHYLIDSRNPNSRFHLALHVSYPNADDRARAKSLGQPTGGAIMIHGVESKFRWLGGLQHDVDWTDGCIAVTDKEMDEIWKAVPIGTPIEIKR